MFPIAIKRRGTWYDPVALMEHEFDRMFRRVWHEKMPMVSWSPAYPVDITEEGNDVIIEAELPGFAKEDISIAIENRTLVLSAQRKHEECKGEVHLSERKFDRIERMLMLPAAVEVERAEASLENGILRVRIPKSSEALAHKINIK